MSASDLDDLLARAQIALSKGDRRGAAVLISHILKHDFTHRNAWQLLHQLARAEEPLEEFQLKFAKEHYPDKAYLLEENVTGFRTPPVESSTTPEEPDLSQVNQIAATKRATTNPARLIVGGGIVALVLIYVASLVVAAIPPILGSVRPQGSPESVVRNWIEATIANDCDKVESYTDTLARSSIGAYCGYGAEVQLLEARIDEVRVSEIGPDEAEVLLIGYFRNSNILFASDQTWETYVFYVRKLNGKWYVFDWY